ncbi:MAG: PTS system mannose/fructose/sorbose family transporter subunit IID [Candidatus Zhuqueibacterota bacterium]
MAQIRKRDVLNMLFRSFFIQASWNSERMIGLGFCFCLIPVARRLFTDREELVNFLNRHLEFFNSHPYMVTYALGAVANIEQQAIQKRWEDKRSVGILKTRIIGPLGAIGDTLFWQLFRPAMGIIGVVLLYSIGVWGALLFFLGYNALHLFIRIRGLLKSYLKGFDIVRDLSMRGTQKYFRALKFLFTLLLAVEMLIVTLLISNQPHPMQGALIFIASSIAAYFLTRKRALSIDIMILLFIFTSFILGLIL